MFLMAHSLNRFSLSSFAVVKGIEGVMGDMCVVVVVVDPGSTLLAFCCRCKMIVF